MEAGTIFHVHTSTRDAFTIERTGLPGKIYLGPGGRMRFRSRPQNCRPEELFGERQRVIKFSKSSGVLLFIYCCDSKLLFKPLQLHVDFFFEASHRANAVLNGFSGLQISFWYW